MSKIAQATRQTPGTPDIKSLAWQAQRLGRSTDSWNSIVMGLMFLTALVGVLYFIATVIQTSKAKQLRLVQDDLLSAKGMQLQIDLRAKDVEISRAQADAAEAKNEAAIATRNAESEKLEREQLELLVSPRRLNLDQQRNIGKACLGISGKPIIVQSYGLDGEGAALASQIVAALGNSGLHVIPQIGNSIVTGESDVGVQIRGPVEETDIVTCLGHAIRDIGNLEVTINGPTHRPGTVMGQNFIGFTAPTAPGQSNLIPVGPLPLGSPVVIMVGIKPLKILPPR